MMDRWFRMLVHTFPQSARSERGQEMLHALEEVAPTGKSAVRESLALVWASSVAWRKYLGTRAAIAHIALFGALLWFGLLLGIGPGLRVRLMAQHGPDYMGWSQQRWPIVVAAVFFVLALLVLGRSRVAAASLGVVAVVASGASATVGQWGIAESVWYEARWSGVALLLVLVAAGFAPVRRWMVAVVPVLLATAVAFMPFPTWSWFGSRNYGFMLRYELSDRVMDLAVSAGLDWLLVLAMGVGLAVPFVFRWAAAIAVPAGVHLMLVTPGTGIMIVGYLAVVLAFHFLRQNATVTIGWRPEQGAARGSSV